MGKEVFELSLLLSIQNNASKGLASFINQLTKLDAKGKQTLAGINNLQKGINKGFSVKDNKLLDYIKQVNKEIAKSNKGISKPNKGSNPNSDPGKAKYNPSAAGEELDKLGGKTEKHYGIVKKLASLNEKVFEPARQIGDTWKREYDSLKTYTDETKKLYLAQAKFKLINLSPEENKKAFDAVTKSVREMGLTTRAEGIESLTDLHNVFGDLGTAIEALPIASKYRFGMETLFGDKYSSNQLTEQIQNTFKFLELTGKVGKGRKEMEQWFEVMTRITASTGGRLAGADFLNMGKTGGTAVQNLSPKGLVNMSTIMQELGGDRTGTSMMSLYQSLVGGVMKQSSAERFDHFGLLDRSKIEYGKAQQIKKVLPGANRLGDPLMDDPLQAADILRNAMKSKGVNTDDSKEVNKELALLFGNRNAQRLMSILINQRGQVLKEAGLVDNAKGAEGMFNLASEDELGKIKKYEKALIEFKTEAGIPLIQIGSQLASSLMPVMKFFGDHPTLTQWTMAAIVGGKALKGIAETASIVSSSGLPSFFSRTTEAAGGTTKVAGGLANTLKSMPTAVQIGLTVALLGLTWDRIQELRKTIDDWGTMNKGLDSAGQGQQRAYEQTPADKRNPGNEAQNVLSLIQQGNKEFEKALDPSKQGWGESFGRVVGAIVGKNTNFPLYTAKVPQNDPKDWMFRQNLAEYQKQGRHSALGDPLVRASKERVGAQFFENRAPVLKDPNVMTSFRRDVLPTLNLSAEIKQHIEKMLQMAFPDSFAQSTKDLSQLTGGLAKSFAELSQQANQQKQGADLLNQFGTNADGLFQIFPQAKENVGNMGDSANKAIAPLDGVGSSARSASGGLDILYGKISSFQMPTIPNFAIPASFSPGGGQPSAMPVRGIQRGGGVKGMMVKAGDADQYPHIENTRQILAANYSGGKGSPTINYSPVTHINGNASAEDIEKSRSKQMLELDRMMAKLMRNGAERA